MAEQNHDLRIGDSVQHPEHGDCIVEGIGNVFADVVYAHPLRIEDEEVFNEAGEIINTGICYGTDSTPVSQIILRKLSTDELIRENVE